MKKTILIHLAAALLVLAIYATDIRDWYILTFTDRIAFTPR